MKNKIFLLSSLFMFSLFFSCSSDDDGVSISQASRDLRGTWELSQIIENNTPVSEIPCSQKTEYRFNSGFTYSEDEFAGVDIDNCTIAATFNGSWENIEDDMVLRLQRAGSETAESFVITFRNNAQVFDIDISSTRTVTFQKVN